MGIFDSILGHAPPGGLLKLAREVGAMAADFNNAPAGSPEYLARAGMVYERRSALVRSEPVTDLDLLALAFTARQALYVLQSIDLTDLDDSKLAYWTSEASEALIGIQDLLERRAGMTMEEMGFDFLNGRRVD